MIEPGAVEELATGALCGALAQLTRLPAGRGRYRELVYSALLSANTLGYNTGFVRATTESGAHVVNAVIDLPTGVVTFRVQWFIGAVSDFAPEVQDKAIADYLGAATHGTLPLMRDPNRCCTRCHVWETREGSYCHNTKCRCHKRR